MTRLQTPGSDNGAWGNILNDFLGQSHNADGMLKADSVNSSQLAPGIIGTPAIADSAITTNKLIDGAITNAKLDSSTQTALAAIPAKYTKPGSGIPAADLDTAGQSALTKATSSVQRINSKLPDGSGLVTLAPVDIGAPTTLATLADVNASGASDLQVLSLAFNLLASVPWCSSW
jgi:hypothetical protein